MKPDPTSPGLTRRDALKVLGLGATLAGLGALLPTAARAQATPSAPTVQPPGPEASAPQPFVLPPLGYAYDALEPHIDARTMEIHHDKHHQAYITNANKALAPHPELRGLTAEAILKNLHGIAEPLRTTLRNNVGGHVNHAFFWRILGPAGSGLPREGDSLTGAIRQSYGSMEAFKAAFGATALKQFGSGWAWLSVSNGKLRIHGTANQDSPLSAGEVPVIGLDVWEHAYYLRHQNVRADYVAAFWNVLNWPQAQANFEAAAGV